jgi:peroxiredoxin
MAMSIQVGDRLPEVTLHEMGEKGPQAVTTSELFGGRKVVLFALPGAFTPTCSAAHLPGYVVKADELRDKGVDSIICLSVNDAWVMNAWGEAQNVEDRVRMVADGAAVFTKAIGLETDMSERGFGLRSQRYAMIVDDGVVTALHVEEPRKFDVSGADSMLAEL